MTFFKKRRMEKAIAEKLLARGIIPKGHPSIEMTYNFQNLFVESIYVIAIEEEDFSLLRQLPSLLAIHEAEDFVKILRDCIEQILPKNRRLHTITVALAINANCQCHLASPIRFRDLSFISP